MNGSHSPVPGWDLKVGLQPLSPLLRTQLTELGVSLSLRQAGRFHLRLADPDTALADGEPFPFGSKVSISLETDGILREVLRAEVTAWGLERTESGTQLLARGLDATHRLRRSHAFAAHPASDDKTLISLLAQPHTLPAKGDPPPPGSRSSRVTVLQLGQTAHGMLLARARRLGLRLGLAENVLSLGKLTYAGPPVQITDPALVSGYDVSQDLRSQPTQVEVVGYDLQKRAPFRVSMGAEGLTWRGSGLTSGVQRTKAAFGDAVHILADLQPADLAEATAMARGYLQDQAQRCVRGVLSMDVFPAARPGQLVKVDLPDCPLNGLWLLEAIHYLLLEGGGSSRLELARPDPL